MDDVPWWWIVAGWGVRLSGWTVATLAGRLRGSGGYGDAARVLAVLPAGSEVGGTQGDGTTWYVRTPRPLGQGESDAH
ncbi:hypothetical protein [Micromonospora carbonacea]|uniref:hypothetical protein n=1 Tax=Micromonospora carbonacea TaxID=47853 RepID=UPI0037242E7F